MDYFEYLISLLNKKNNVVEVPIAALVIKNGKIISKAVNKKMKTNICMYHAEALAIMKAEKRLHDWRLEDCDLYVTLEPCLMCKEIIKQARIKNVYFLLKSTFNNEDNKNINYNHVDCDLSKKYHKMIREFFVNKR